MMCTLKLLILIICCCLSGNYGANILIITPLPSTSHHLWNHRIAMALVEKGHNVTMVGPDAKKLEQPKNYHPIVFEKVYDIFELMGDFVLEETSDGSIFTMISMFIKYIELCSEYQLKSDGFKQLMDYPDDFKFDLIIMDITIGPTMYPFIKKFNYPPTVGVTAFLLPTYVSHIYGNHLHPSYIPWYQTTYLEDMTFFQRVVNYVLTHLDIFIKKYYEYGVYDKYVKEYFGERADDLFKLERHINLILSNTDPLIDMPQPLTPNIIPVGGLHARPSKPLPQDLKDVIENAKDGVILFSLGTNVRSDKLKPDTIKSIVGAFAKLKQTVIWKFESEIDNLPKNVIVRKWLPQNDILGHKNTLVFVNHGGALSTQEAMYHGKPMLSIPFFADQFVNAEKTQYRQIGLKVENSKITTEYLYDKFQEVLNNPIYAKNSQDLSRRFRDQPQTPLERAVFWIEHAIRNNGSAFLNTKARDLPLFVSESTDVKVFLITLAALSIYLIVISVRFLRKLIPCKKCKVKTN